MQVYYIGSYSPEEISDEKRIIFPASMTKCEYITKVLKDEGYNVSIVSAPITENVKGVYKTKSGRNDEGIFYTIGPTFGTHSFVGKKIQKLFSRLWVLGYLIKNVKKNDVVIAYHAISNIIPVFMSKLIKKYTLILEVEERYSTFQEVSKIKGIIERRYLLYPDKYIFACEQLRELINLEKRPCVISYGSYDLNSYVDKTWEGIVDIVYAGTFDERKKGAQNAVLMAPFLPKNYRIHILGFGTKAETESIVSLIEATNKISQCNIVFEGCLMGKEYSDFLDTCSIGLSTQTPEGDYNLTSFPSKVLVYLAHNLTVVSTRIEVLEQSEIGKYIFFSDGFSPCDYAYAVVSASKAKVPGRVVVSELDKNFRKSMKELIGRI